MAALDSLTLRGFKSILNLDKFRLGKMNLLIGANGSGKSNFVSFFSLLNNLIEGQLAPYVANQGGPDRFLHRGREVSPSFGAEMEFGYNGYCVELKPTTDNRFFFEKELLSFSGREGPFGFVHPTTRPLGQGYFESKAKEQLENDYNKTIAGYVVPAIQSWRVYHFHDTSDNAKVKRIHAINENVRLASDAGNLAAFLLRLREEKKEHYDRIRETVSLVAPCFDDFVLRPSGKNQDSIQLEWKAKGVSESQPFLPHHLSDGTLRFICLATLLMNPLRPSTIIIDEPELGLHPYAVKILASLLDEAAQRTQLIVATQCAQLVNEMEPGDVIITSMEEGVSKFERLDPEKLKPWLEDYSLSELWDKNVVGGRP